MKTAGSQERFVDRGEIVRVRARGYCRANGVEIAKGGEESKRARQQAFAVKQIQQPDGARSNESVDDGGSHDRPGVEQHLRARRACEPALPLFAERIAVGARRESEQA